MKPLIFSAHYEDNNLQNHRPCSKYLKLGLQKMGKVVFLSELQSMTTAMWSKKILLADLCIKKKKENRRWQSPKPFLFLKVCSIQYWVFLVSFATWAMDTPKLNLPLCGMNLIMQRNSFLKEEITLYIFFALCDIQIHSGPLPSEFL